jgi:hypothetical protein
MHPPMMYERGAGSGSRCGTNGERSRSWRTTGLSNLATAWSPRFRSLERDDAVSVGDDVVAATVDLDYIADSQVELLYVDSHC